MINKISSLYILSALLLTAGVFAFADEPSSSLDDKPSVDTAASTGVDVPAVPSDASSYTHTSYLYDLQKLIEKSRENIKEVNDKIKEQAVLKRNQEREERSHEYYEKGEELTKEGKLDEAREYYEKAIRITEHPEMAGYIKESQRRLKRQEEALHAQERQHYNQIKQDANTRKEDVEVAYRNAIDLYKQKKYHPAKDAFEHVDEIAPDYRATNSYLKLIDQNIVTEDALAVKEKAVEMARQEKEAEAAQAKEKAAWLAQIEEKEKVSKEKIDKQADDAYTLAIDLYKKKRFAEAKKKFEEVSWVIPDYKDTMMYLRRIDHDAQVEEEHVSEEKEKSLKEQQWEDLVASKKQELARQHEMEIQERKHRKELEEQAQFLYAAAVAMYDKKDMDDAWVKFNDIEKTCPDYRSTRTYLVRIEQSNPVKFKVLVPATPVQSTVSPEQVELSSSLEVQQQQMLEISELARRAAYLYSEIVGISGDRSTDQMKRKMAEVNSILNNLKEKQGRLLHQLRQEQSNQQAQESRARQEELKAKAEKMYQDGIKSLRMHDYEKAKMEFLQLENVIPDYKSTQRYLKRLEEDQNESNVGAASGYEHNEADHLKLLQGKENAEEMLRVQQEREKQRNIELQQHAALQNLAEKASGINDDIIRLSREQDYEAMKAKFTELENTITALTTLQDSMSKQKDLLKREKQLANESDRRREEMYNTQKPLTENRPQYQPADINHYKHTEIIQEENMLFNEAVGLYKEKKYVQAKLLFSELAGQHDRRADAWLKKVDRGITREILKTQEEKERERTAFIAEQVKAQRQLIVIQERERQRQKKLSEELERQKRLYEDDRALQLRKEETLKAQERERETQEEKRLRLEKENEKEQEMLRFHRIGTNAQSQPAVVEQPPMATQHPALALSTPIEPEIVSSQADLEARRRAVRKQLEDGVEIMYKEAMNLYKQGNYTAATYKFKDVQDILPGYKHAEQYMDEARQKSLSENPQSVTTPDATEASTNIPTTPVVVSSPSSVSRDDSVSKALDLFDSNVK